MKSVILVIGIIVMIFFTIAAFLYPFYKRKGHFKWFYHDWLLWHVPDDAPQWSDGCSFHSTCKYCNKEIMQDSQGNWF